jgi:hypothetical protein
LLEMYIHFRSFHVRHQEMRTATRLVN